MFQSLLNCEWIFISQVIYRVNCCTTYEEFCNVCLCNLKGLFQFSQGVAFQASIVDGRPKLRAPYSIDSNSQYYDVGFYLEHNYNPKWTDYFFSPWCSVFRYSDISEAENWIESRIFKEVLQPLNLYYGLYNTLIYNDTVLGAVVLWRSKKEGDFTEREVYIMECLKNHLALKLYSLIIGPLSVEKTALECQARMTLFSEQYSLTKRELEIAHMLFSGKGTEEICHSLYITPSTLRKHLYNIYRKTGVNSREKLVQLMKEN